MTSNKWHGVESGALKAAKYNAEAKTFDVVFKDGTTYRYGQVSKSEAAEFADSQSKGVWFNTNIKGVSAEEGRKAFASKPVLKLPFADVEDKPKKVKAEPVKLSQAMEKAACSWPHRLAEPDLGERQRVYRGTCFGQGLRPRPRQWTGGRCSCEREGAGDGRHRVEDIPGVEIR